MENKVKGTIRMLEIILAAINIGMTIISIIVTGVNIIQTARENEKHQKSNRSDQS